MLLLLILLIVILAVIHLYKRVEVIYYYRDGCPFCVDFAPTWDLVSKSSNPNIIYIKRDVNKKRCNVSGVPTIMLKKGDQVYTYYGDRSINDLRMFIESHC